MSTSETTNTTASDLLVERDGGVAVVRLNRPERLNALTHDMVVRIGELFAGLDEDDAVRAIVLTGTGRAFCAGTDLSSGGSTWSNQDDWGERELSFDRWKMKTPVIAAVNGHAMGGGFTEALLCDIRIVAEDAKLGLVFARRGIIGDGQLHWLLPRLIGAARALDILLTGRTLSGREAAEIGLAREALPAAEVLPAAMTLAHDLAANTAPVSVGVMKALTYRLLSEPDREAAAAIQWEMFKWAGRQADASEGIAAFLERREPSWKMSKSQDFPAERIEELLKRR